MLLHGYELKMYFGFNKVLAFIQLFEKLLIIFALEARLGQTDQN